MLRMTEVEFPVVEDTEQPDGRVARKVRHRRVDREHRLPVLDVVPDGDQPAEKDELLMIVVKLRAYIVGGELRGRLLHTSFRDICHSNLMQSWPCKRLQWHSPSATVK